ncbi:hypothetical protein PV11_07561 [Exophiala sideris]|uniref:nitrilase n=1 Tax=Exophiala sideris TaxID=1016849 RepID=A0A0D1YAN1_9EURO|nr:hypothetical protein PV11_07561 [Exophiala sideris]
MTRALRLGAVQAEPVWQDLEAAVEKTISLIQEASKKGVHVLGFPEVWITGYPWAIWSRPALQNAMFAEKYIANSMGRNSPEMKRIQAAVKEAQIFVILGYSEREGQSIYITQSFISPAGEILHTRRKIKPTHVERSLWGDGQGDSLTTVVTTPSSQLPLDSPLENMKIGGLNCWENIQPLLRYYCYSQGVQVHVAGWPPFPAHPRDSEIPTPYHNTAEANYRISQNAAMEGQMFVICTTQVLTEKYHELLGLKDLGLFPRTGGAGGFAMIFGPDGSELVEPLSPGEEGILVADIPDYEQSIRLAKHMCDPVGQYSRPDMLSLRVNPVKAECVTFTAPMEKEVKGII